MLRAIFFCPTSSTLCAVVIYKGSDNLTKTEIYEAYIHWAKEPLNKIETDTFHLPVGNFDVYEDENVLINKAYYMITEYYEQSLRCFLFYELNTFQKATNGDLNLISSVLEIERTD